MRDMQATADGLRSAIERSGYYPGLVADAVSSALGSEAVVSFFVHHDALFDPAMEHRREPGRGPVGPPAGGDEHRGGAFLPDLLGGGDPRRVRPGLLRSRGDDAQ
jgi:hypothetical protein